MKSVGIYTNTAIKCGNAEYARDLSYYLQPYYTVRMSPVWTDLIPFDVIIINWHPSVVEFSAEFAQKLKERGKKLILVLQNSFEDVILDVRKDPILKSVDAVVSHEPMGEGIHFIPIGIHVYGGLPSVSDVMMIGTAGFPFPWKRFDVVAEIAKVLQVRCRMIAPTYDGVNTDTLIQGIQGHLGSLAEIHRDWMSALDVVRLLAECRVNIFYYTSMSYEDTLGQTGSARMGVSAGRPMIISRHRKFRTLFPYEDELYIALHETEVMKFANEILFGDKEPKVPKRLLSEMGWPNVVLKYKEIIDSL